MSELPTGPRSAPDLPRAALERVLLRAAELHTAQGELPEVMTEADLLKLAEEVGIAPLAVRQALAEERMRVTLPEERGMLAAVVGPAGFAASRVVGGSAKDLLARLDRAMESDENLTERRRFPDRVVWGARGGFAGAVRGLVRLDGRGFPLTKADEVSATVLQVEAGKVHVRLEASMATRRARTLRNGLLGVLGGGVVTAALLAMSVMAPLAIAAGAVLAVSAPQLARRGYRRDAQATQLTIEQTLDRLEFGDGKKRTLLDQLLLPKT